MEVARPAHAYLSHSDCHRPVDQVDDLTEGKGAEFVDASRVTLVFCSEGYFRSANCIRELLRAAVTQKPMVALVEVDPKHGGMARSQIRQQLAVAGTTEYVRWGLAAEVPHSCT